jgi:hypothetical protein
MKQTFPAHNMQLNPMLGNTGIAGAIPKSTAQALAARRYASLKR